MGPLDSSHPLFMLAVWSPAISAWAVILATSGLSGFRGYLTRLTVWRCSWPWVLLLLVGIPLIYYAGALVKGERFALWPFESASAALAAIGLMAMLGPIEEFGWRDLAQPLVQRRMNPFWAAIVIGIIWGLWHLPAFLLSGTPQSNWDFMPFFVGAVAISVLITPLFNRTGGGILLPMLYHFQLNNPIWPDALPWDIPFFVAAAAIVTWLNRDRMFDRAGGVTLVTGIDKRLAA